MMKTFIILLFTVIFVFFPSRAAAEDIPLEAAVQKGMERAAALRNRLLDERVKALEKKNAIMRKYFSVDSGASYLFKSEQMHISFPGMSVTAGAKHNYDLNVSVRQPIFTGNILDRSVKVSELQSAIAQSQTALEKNEIAASVKTSYFNYRLLASKRKSLETFTHSLDIHFKNLERLYKEELVRKTDLLETRRKLREQEIAMEELNQLMVSEKIEFEKLCGLDIDTIETGYGEAVGDYEGVFLEFKSSHPVLEALSNRLAVLSTRGKMVKGEYLPQVAGFAELHYGRPGIDFFKNEWGVYFQGGVSFSLRLFDWGRQTRELTVLDYESQKVMNERDDFILEVEKRLKQLFGSLRSVEKRMSIVAGLVELADEDVRLKEGLYREQQVSNLDYLDALAVKERYESMKDELKMQYELIKVTINRIKGKEIL